MLLSETLLVIVEINLSIANLEIGMHHEGMFFFDVLKLPHTI